MRNLFDTHLIPIDSSFKNAHLNDPRLTVDRSRTVSVTVFQMRAVSGGRGLGFFYLVGPSRFIGKASGVTRTVLPVVVRRTATMPTGLENYFGKKKNPENDIYVCTHFYAN